MRRSASARSACSAAPSHAFPPTRPPSPIASAQIMVAFIAASENADDARHATTLWAQEGIDAARAGRGPRLRATSSPATQGPTHRRGLSARDVGPAARDQAAVRSREPVPAEPEHPAGLTAGWGPARQVRTCRCWSVRELSRPESIPPRPLPRSPCRVAAGGGRCRRRRRRRR